MNSARGMPHVVIVGGGISGLSAAWQITRDLPGARVTVLEADPRWGGKIRTERVTLPGGEAVVDCGPESFITRKSAAWELALALGMRSRIQAVAGETRNIYVLRKGRPVLVPLAPGAFIKSDLLTMRGKLRLMAEPFMPARRDGGDESLADFVSRRLGREALEQFLGPILGGIYNTDPEQQSILVTSPVMREMERDHGSLVAASIVRGRRKARLRKELAARGETLPPAFMAFAGGAQEMVDELVAQLLALPGVTLRSQATVSSIEQKGPRSWVALASGERLSADAVILATPANVASRLLAQSAPDAAALLQQIRHAGIGTLSLAYRAQDLEVGFPISGLMIPRREQRAIDAITFTSQRFPERLPAGIGMIRVFYGGSAPHMLALDDAQLLTAIRFELRALLGINAEPLASCGARWPNSYPQAGVGHLALVDEIESALPAGLYVTGSAYRGLGVPDCVAQGVATAQQAAQFLREQRDRSVEVVY